MLQYSTIASIVYFVINIIFLNILCFAVYRQNQYDSIKSKLYIKDVWNQRKILAPLIIHFYDTATDIGVIYNWSILMRKEQNDPLIDYESVNMTIFFWSGITFLIIYRVCVLIYTLYIWYDGDGEWYHVILVLCDLYIFVVVYESFSEAQGIITSNALKRQRNQQKKREKKEELRKQKELEKQMEVAIQNANITKSTKERNDKDDEKEDEEELKPSGSRLCCKCLNVSQSQKDAQKDAQEEAEEEIEPSDSQSMLQIIESITESMPQIVLQSVFIIRSANDSTLTDAGSNIYLIMFSVIASLVSIASKFIYADKDYVRQDAKSLKPHAKFPQCCNYWYIARVLWKMSHVMSKFVVFTMIWTVMGGAWLPIWIGIAWILWTIYLLNDPVDNHGPCESAVMSIALIVSVFGAQKDDYPVFIVKFIETTIGLIVITVFAVFRFDCGICADPEKRQLFGNTNHRILIFWALGWASSIFDIISFIILHKKHIFV